MGLYGYGSDGEIDHLLQELGQPVVGVTSQRSGQGNPGESTISTPPDKGGQHRQCRGRKIIGKHGAKAD